MGLVFECCLHFLDLALQEFYLYNANKNEGQSMSKYLLSSLTDY
jgi:hypothetical protein